MYQYNRDERNDWKNEEADPYTTGWGWLVDIIVVMLVIMAVISSML
jgi:hypothetical protein